MLFSCLFQCFEEKEYQTESKRNETFGRVIFGTEAIQETWSIHEGLTRQGSGLNGTFGQSEELRCVIAVIRQYVLFPF